MAHVRRIKLADIDTTYPKNVRQLEIALNDLQAGEWLSEYYESKEEWTIDVFRGTTTGNAPYWVVYTHDNKKSGPYRTIANTREAYLAAMLDLEIAVVAESTVHKALFGSDE